MEARVGVQGDPTGRRHSRRRNVPRGRRALGFAVGRLETARRPRVTQIRPNCRAQKPIKTIFWGTQLLRRRQLHYEEPLQPTERGVRGGRQVQPWQQVHVRAGDQTRGF